jgi:septum formation protein
MYPENDSSKTDLGTSEPQASSRQAGSTQIPLQEVQAASSWSHRLPLILASQSPRRRELMTQAGYDFRVDQPDPNAECGICSRETPPEMVARLAVQKAADVAQRTAEGIVIGCDTVAECMGKVLGKPEDRKHAQEMLELLSGRPHSVYSGLCLWRRPDDKKLLRVALSRLQMLPLTKKQIDEYLDSELWMGKAGAFGYQDNHPWLQLVEGSASNVVGLPMELLAEMLQEF